MPRLKSEMWDHFDRCSEDEKIAACKYCSRVISYKGSTTNLKTHLRLKHPRVFANLIQKGPKGRHATNLKYHMSSKHNIEVDKDNVIYEYVVGSPTSTGSNDSAEENDDKSTAKVAKELDSSATEPIYLRRRSAPKGPAKGRRLIDQLTEEKIFITALQKDLVEKELEEKNLKVQLLQAEMEHKKEMYELEKQELMLRIEVLKAKLPSNNVPTNGRLQS